jgi:molybdopterin-guanine dinucleotide biosynthesis protein A
MTSSQPAFSGAVLTGGRSSRMGRDKAFIEIDGRAMVLIAQRALLDAGASRVVTIGGDTAALAALGLETLSDTAPGEGPLGGIIDALENSDDDLVVVLACDHPTINHHLVRLLVETIADDDAAVPVVDGTPQPLAAVYARRCLPALRTAFEGGERSPQTALRQLQWRGVHDVDPSWVRDVDEPGDVASYAAQRQPPVPDQR